jgi:hypothetical protein
LDELELIPDSLDERRIGLIVAVRTETYFGILSLIILKFDLENDFFMLSKKGKSILPF